jgi:DNA-binding MarR family transcriptional regulator
MREVKPPPTVFEQHLRDFLAERGADPDAVSTVFNLDHTSMDVLSTMEAVALRPHDLSHAGFVMMMTLWVTGPRETRELASVLRVTKGAVVGAVDTLQRRGLVRRQRSEADKRLVTMELTAEGAEVIARAQRDWHAMEREVSAALTPDEQLTFASLCRKLSAGARQVRQAHREAGAPALPDPDKFLPERPRATFAAPATSR